MSRRKRNTNQMELEPDLSKISHLRPSTRTNERSGLWWIIVIALGVLTGNTLSYGAKELHTRWQLRELMIVAEAMTEKQRANAAALAKQNAKQRSINARFQQTCNFWRSQVKSEDTAQNRQYRDTACAKVRGLLR